MAYTGLGAESTLGLATTIDPAGSLAGLEINPVGPPGRQWDATADLHPPKSGHYPAAVHQLTALMGGTITTGQVWTALVTVESTAQGSGTSSQFIPITLSITVGATQTATAVADLFVTAAAASSEALTLAAVGARTRLYEVATFTADTGTLTMDAVEAGLVFTVVFTPQSGGTAPVVITPGKNAVVPNLRVGIFVGFDKGVVSSDGITPIVRLLVAGDTADNVYGVVMDASRNEPIITADGSYEFVSYRAGRDVPILPLSGRQTATTDAATLAGGDLWVRTTATGDQVAGAASSSPGAIVYTITPAVFNDTRYTGTLQVFDGAGGQVASSGFDYLSDAGALDTEIVTGITAELTGSAVDDFLTLGGTATLTLSMTEGFTAVLSASPTLLAIGAAPTSPTHVRLAATFKRGTVAGVGDVLYAHQ